MEISSTRISDLPVRPPSSFSAEHGLEIPGLGPNQGQQPMNPGQPPSQGYMQMNVHSNPYSGQPPMTNPVPPPHPNSRNYSGVTPSIQKSPEYSIPSRDIPMDTANYTQDKMVRPDYIPDDKIYDYLQEYEPPVEEESETKENNLGDTIATFQIPIMVAILFFIFQSNTLNVLLNKYASSLHLFGEDGNINFYGIALKSILFGLAYYGMNYMVTML